MGPESRNRLTCEGKAQSDSGSGSPVLLVERGGRVRLPYHQTLLEAALLHNLTLPPTSHAGCFSLRATSLLPAASWFEKEEETRC